MMRQETFAKYTIYVYRVLKDNRKMSQMEMKACMSRYGWTYSAKSFSESIQKMVYAGLLIEEYDTPDNLLGAVYSRPPVDDYRITYAIKRAVKRYTTWRGVFVKDLPKLLPEYDATAVTVVALSLAATGKVPHTIGTHGVKLR